MTAPPTFDHLFLGIGAMKAGTTWLYSVLQHHPDIHFSHEKEIHYFYAQDQRPGLLSELARMRRAKGYLHFDPEISAPAVLQKRVAWTANWLAHPVDDAWFNGLFLHRGAARWISDFSNLNALLSEDEWRKLHARCRRLKVLYTLRHPVDRIWSHVRFHLKMQGKGALLDEWTLDDLMAHIESPDSDYLIHSDYVAALTRIRAALPEPCLHIAFYDQIATDPAGQIRRIEDHLGLPHADFPADLITRVVNPSPTRAMPDGLADRLAPFAARQVAGLQALGIPLPKDWP